MKGQEIRGQIPLGTIVGPTQDIDASKANYFSLTAGANLTLNVKNLKPGHEVVVDWTQDATGSRTLTWGAADATLGQAAVTASTAPGLAPVATASLNTIFKLMGTSDTCVAARIVSRQIV